MEFLQITFLAILQGVTEFLPISSSGHLILPAELFGWEDQGLVFDVSVHVGSLFAVLYYFRGHVIELGTAWLRSLTGGQATSQSRLAWLIILATVPAGLAGLLFNDLVEQYGRSILLIAFTSIFFAGLLYLADRRIGSNRDLSDLNWKSATLIGLAQMLALIPGTSRSGATMTAGLFANLSRHAAAQFSFLLAIPIIAASGLLKVLDFYQLGASVSDWVTLLYGVIVSGVVSYFCIHYFLKLIERLGFLPFVIYRIVLGLMLFGVYFSR
ncbi:MAG: undecaprenyl-diphosphate phosphatase [Gammaproteobacteria bacterium]|nr:undecaprenyl-diphosphate phosphatase [Pseudomonadales bacterium]MCP5346431.1 undecaprenyl-diphosphate phosphatase [Pseudomonadales bacterium]